ncbi:hypothetical protein LZ318_12975 [Saccharopolyspora indica]|uniref:AfsR/SARP family transcriptional regulator n=1 Tax=Saccharopolyspora indica TaxID=1229659 RepID=UPI0022EB13B9|nr:BTAD domain-containing putative transcriptional regulator [Saccharopolyspora indica]MDA3647192.1 BTAD domain-containing putative transcriptional regulator [Saccharopolyspora indica]
MLFHVLGPLAVRGRNGGVMRLGTSKPAVVLATLLLQPNAWVGVDQLIARTWPEAAVPPSAVANVKTYVWRLRGMLPTARIETGPGSYRLRVAAGELDTDRAADLAAEAERFLARGDATAAATTAARALDLWRGRPFDGLHLPGDWAAELDELHRDLRQTLAEARLALGDARRAVGSLRELTAEDPFREESWAALIGALHVLGRRAEALANYREIRKILADELGVPPGPALTEVGDRVLGPRGAPDLFRARAALAVVAT